VNLAKLRYSRSQRNKKDQTFRYFIFFLNFDLAKGGASAPVVSFLVVPLILGTNFCHWNVFGFWLTNFGSISSCF